MLTISSSDSHLILMSDARSAYASLRPDERQRIEQRLRRLSEFFGQVICRFVMRDVGMLVDKCTSLRRPPDARIDLSHQQLATRTFFQNRCQTIGYMVLGVVEGGKAGAPARKLSFAPAAMLNLSRAPLILGEAAARRVVTVCECVEACTDGDELCCLRQVDGDDLDGGERENERESF